MEVLSVMEAKSEDAPVAIQQQERLLFIFHTLVSYKGGAKITKPEAACQVRGEHCLLRFNTKKNQNQVHILSLCPCRRCCSWFRARLCQFLVPASSYRSPPPCCSGRTSPCPTCSFRTPSTRCVSAVLGGTGIVGSTGTCFDNVSLSEKWCFSWIVL